MQVILLAIITAKKSYVAIPLISVFLVITFTPYAAVILTAIVSILGTAICSLLVALYMRKSSNRIQARKEFEARLASVQTQVAVLEHKINNGKDDPKNESDLVSN